MAKERRYEGINPMLGYAIYEKHYDSNPCHYVRDSGIVYTFFGDMLVYAAYNSGDKLLKKLQGYEQRMLTQYCKKDPKAYCVMIDSLNLLGWYLYKHNNNKTDAVIDWLFSEYERLFYTDWKNYVSESDMASIRRELN